MLIWDKFLVVSKVQSLFVNKSDFSRYDSNFVKSKFGTTVTVPYPSYPEQNKLM